jgi:hypothetical protein
MKITHVNNSVFAEVEVFVDEQHKQTLSSDEDREITPTSDRITIPVINNASDFGNGIYAVARRTDNVQNAVRFWEDSNEVVWYLAHPNLTNYDLKKEVPMVKQRNDKRAALKLHVINLDSDYAARQIGIVGEMVVDIVTDH